MEGKHSFRPVVALARSRLQRSTGGRVSAIAGAILAVAFGVIAIGLRAGDGAGVSLGGLLETAARWIAWGAGAPIALAAAGPRAAVDRADGIDALVNARGFHRAALESARAIAAMAQTSIAIAAPLGALSILSVVATGSIASALRHAGLAVGLALFSILAGVTVGFAAAACSRAGGPRGKWIFAGIILIPWVLSDLFGYHAWSIPGALNAALGFVVRASGLGGTSL